jgi:homopolymeric O-antigen transport system permease protein
MLTAVWRYRGFVLGMVRREFQVRYLHSVLGSVWAVIGPLSTIVIYTVIFGRLMRARLPGVDDSLAYGVFLCAGVTTWGMFSEVIQRCLSIFIEHANLLKKMSFPRGTLPVIVLLSAAVNFAIVFVLLLLFLAVTGRFPGWSLVAFLPLLIVQQSLALGLGVALGVVNVFFRDVAHAAATLLQFWFWLTPIVYPQQIVGETVQRLLDLNPLTRVVLAYQAILLRGTWPDWSQLLLPALSALAALALGAIAFRRLSGEMVDCL